ncbi:MAG: hypothetical protein M3198_10585 [Actinomycetota bacterium]|nr:hypothetical protein [Actinomycetota bacterium]
MQRSASVRHGILRCYERFPAGEAPDSAQVIAEAEGVSVIGAAPARLTTDG